MQEASQMGNVVQNVIGNIQKTSKYQYSEPEFDWSKLLNDMPKRHQQRIENKSGEWAEARDKLCERLGKGFICALVGNRGTGKTKMAVNIASVLAKKFHKNSRYCKAMEVFMEIRQTYDGGNKNEREAIRPYLSVHLLIIDEAHERGGSEWEDRMLTYIIDKRYDAMLDTLLISNEPAEKFISSVGISVSSRLQETGGIIRCEWESFRKQKGVQGEHNDGIDIGVDAGGVGRQA